MRFDKNIVITGKIKLKTGLHIGGLKETVEIGGVDNPVITTYRRYDDEFTRVPYIPGSSLKGKIRALLDLAYADDISNDKNKRNDSGYVQVGDNYIKYENNKAKLIYKIFGIPANSKGYEDNITRVIFRDAFPTHDTIKEWNKYPDIVGGTEVKPENSVNRITSRANPRFFERIPASSEFEFEIVLTIYEGDDEKAFISLLLEGMKKLEDSYIGGMGSRGYGKIKFHIDKIAERTKEFYEGGEEKNYKEFAGGSIDDLLKKLAE